MAGVVKPKRRGGRKPKKDALRPTVGQSTGGLLVNDYGEWDLNAVDSINGSVSVSSSKDVNNQGCGILKKGESVLFRPVDVARENVGVLYSPVSFKADLNGDKVRDTDGMRTGLPVGNLNSFNIFNDDGQRHLGYLVKDCGTGDYGDDVDEEGFIKVRRRRRRAKRDIPFVPPDEACSKNTDTWIREDVAFAQTVAPTSCDDDSYGGVFGSVRRRARGYMRMDEDSVDALDEDDISLKSLASILKDYRPEDHDAVDDDENNEVAYDGGSSRVDLANKVPDDMTPLVCDETLMPAGKKDVATDKGRHLQMCAKRGCCLAFPRSCNSNAIERLI
ncbi:hypothetical protein SK128_027400 [Halocaridina rubra]|uniref:Uncharacterized protein n=1 Tax=Halocaridina rubra TaxID=373956 RepID=A0AAN9A123_HALRR